MIRYLTGDMFKQNADCLINTVNLEGYMGKGIAYQFKSRFPQNNKQYIKDCKTGEIRIGKVTDFTEDGITIINFPTKDKWREPSREEYIVRGLDSFVKILPNLDVKKIAIPPLGCGNGGLNWYEIKPIIEDKIDDYKNAYEFLIFEPSLEYKPVIIKAPKMYASSLVLLDIKLRLKKITKARLQKASYLVNLFLGEDYFRFDKYKYGPYSHDIDIISKQLGEYQRFYSIGNSKDTYDSIYKIICSEKVNNTLSRLQSPILRATDYINSIESEFDMECISTILYIISNSKHNNAESIIENFKNWSEYKAEKFSERDIIRCIEYLEKTALISSNIFGEYEIIDRALSLK